MVPRVSGTLVRWACWDYEVHEPEGQHSLVQGGLCQSMVEPWHPLNGAKLKESQNGIEPVSLVLGREQILAQLLLEVAKFSR